MKSKPFADMVVEAIAEGYTTVGEISKRIYPDLCSWNRERANQRIRNVCNTDPRIVRKGYKHVKVYDVPGNTRYVEWGLVEVELLIVQVSLPSSYRTYHLDTYEDAREFSRRFGPDMFNKARMLRTGQSITIKCKMNSKLEEEA